MDPPPADAEWLYPAMFAAGCALLTFILLRRSFRKLGRRRRVDTAAIAAQPRP